MMDVCECEPYIDQNKRIMRVQRIVCFLAKLEGRDPQVKETRNTLDYPKQGQTNGS